MIALALGIGANTAIFGVVNAVLLRPLAYKDADRLVTILHNGTGPVATANYIDWRDQSHAFEAMGAADYWSPNLTSNDSSDSSPAEHLYGLKVTQNLLPMLGVEPLLGRLFAKGEDQEGADHEVDIELPLWQRRFSGDREVLGKPITLDGEAYTVVGVMPPGVQVCAVLGDACGVMGAGCVWRRMHERGGQPSSCLCAAEAGCHSRSGAGGYGDSHRPVGKAISRDQPQCSWLRPLKENVVGKIETPLLMMLGAVGFVLLIACANVAHMLLARTSDRQKEIAVRVALGAGKSRLVAQFLTESLLLAAVGAACGIAAWRSREQRRWSP